MEFYLLITFFTLYILSSFYFKNKAIVRRVWFLSFVAVFIVTSMSIIYLRIGSKEFMINVASMGMMYLAYISASLMVFLGLINAWIFRKTIWQILAGKSMNNEECSITKEEIDKEVEQAIKKMK